MKMTKFRVQNYKNIEDTDWISCENLAAFVGKNEAGKSALFRGLSKLNPSDGEEYDGLKEFPRRRYTSEFEELDYPVASVEFELFDEEKDKLKEICPLLSDIEKVKCTRYYSWDLDIKFKPEVTLPEEVNNGAFLEVVKELIIQVQNLSAPDERGEELRDIKTRLSDVLNQVKNELTPLPPEQHLNEQHLDTLISAFLVEMNEEWQTRKFETFITKLRQFENPIELQAQIDETMEWIEKNIPQFIYFDRYDVIDSAINIIHFANQLRDDPSAHRVRATKCLFEHVGLDINDIINLDPNQPDISEAQLRDMADERAIKMSSASTAMTEMFSEWWEQRKHRFRYQIDGRFFRVWVSDNLDPSEIELDQRSLGLQYYFSFYVVFLVEARDAHVNSILLLDEPGLHMHGTAQSQIVKFLEKLSDNNQTLYTTHSPFMIDGDHLERVRAVYESEGGTAKVSEDVWPRDKDTLFPLQAALGYSIAQTLFYAKRQVIVEGITDYSIFKVTNEILLEKGMDGLPEDIILVPAGGVRNLMPLASMLIGHDVEIAVILDSDKPARQAGQALKHKLLKDSPANCIFLGDYVSKQEAELEDLFPEDFYLKAVSETYGFPLNFIADEENISNISKRVSAAFERLGKGSFEKWRPINTIIDWIGTDREIIPQETLETFSKIFLEVNNLFQEMD